MASGLGAPSAVQHHRDVDLVRVVPARVLHAELPLPPFLGSPSPSVAIPQQGPSPPWAAVGFREGLLHSLYLPTREASSHFQALTHVGP